MDENADVDKVIEALGLTPALAGVVLVNRRRSSREKVLREGDKVAILPRITGG